mmetsp:Transcript_3093/g.10670  ORF Transcript_3093/g.10670 Transcript_3093/m.10670 type:complete len:218 (+) Transcript_3093:178-831(+)
MSGSSSSRPSTTRTTPSPQVSSDRAGRTIPPAATSHPAAGRSALEAPSTPSTNGARSGASSGRRLSQAATAGAMVPDSGIGSLSRRDLGYAGLLAAVCRTGTTDLVRQPSTPRARGLVSRRSASRPAPHPELGPRRSSQRGRGGRLSSRRASAARCAASTRATTPASTIRASGSGATGCCSATATAATPPATLSVARRPSWRCPRASGTARGAVRLA